MNLSDWIQLSMLAVIAASVATLIWQTIIQNRVLRAQLLRDRLDTYWFTYKPITDADVETLRAYPEDFMTRDLYYERYAENTDAIKRYIAMSQIYEFLAFSYPIKGMKPDDPVGPAWIKKWTEDLLDSTEFIDVHKQYAGYYPPYEAMVNELLELKEHEVGAAL